jgi:hypothetical protein
MAFDPGRDRKKQPLKPEEVDFLCAEVDDEMDKIIQEAWEKEFDELDFTNWYDKFGGKTE